MILIVLVLWVVAISYYLLRRNYQYWQKKGVPGPKPITLLGNIGRSLFFQASPGQLYADIYNKFPSHEMVGVYRITTPVLLIRDPELIKEVTVKSFSHFHDNDFNVDKTMDPIFGRHPVVLRDEEWRIVRAQLTPAFTGAKMKALFPMLEEGSKDLVNFIATRPETTNGQGYEVKEMCARYALDNVAHYGFGLDGKCFDEENSHFRQLAKELLAPDSWNVFMFFLETLYPELSTIVPMRFISKPLETKFIDLVKQTMKYRQDNNIVRNDFLHMITQLKDNCKDYKFTDLDVTGHAVTFFGDGCETCSIVMSFALFELARHPEVQNSLRQEIKVAFDDNDQKIPYDVIHSLPYLDAVVNETLRLHPPVPVLQRTCTKTFTYTPSTNKPVTIEKGTPIILPVLALHHDPRYYPEPGVFKPERFLGSNKDTLTKYAFMPFGEGPRACLGQRFGVSQIKTGIAHVMKNYELSVNRKTQLPIKYRVDNVLSTPVGGLWLDFKKIL